MDAAFGRFLLVGLVYFRRNPDEFRRQRNCQREMSPPQQSREKSIVETVFFSGDESAPVPRPFRKGTNHKRGNWTNSVRNKVKTSRIDVSPRVSKWRKLVELIAETDAYFEDISKKLNLVRVEEIVG